MAFSEDDHRSLAAFFPMPLRTRNICSSSRMSGEPCRVVHRCPLKLDFPPPRSSQTWPSPRLFPYFSAQPSQKLVPQKFRVESLNQFSIFRSFGRRRPPPPCWTFRRAFTRCPWRTRIDLYRLPGGMDLKVRSVLVKPARWDERRVVG